MGLRRARAGEPGWQSEASARLGSQAPWTGPVGKGAGGRGLNGRGAEAGLLPAPQLSHHTSSLFRTKPGPQAWGTYCESQRGRRLGRRATISDL